MTILVIYYIIKKYPELMNELIIIIKKGKFYIEKQIKSNYEAIIKELKI